MVLLSSSIGFLEIIIFLLAVLAFTMAVRFFMDSRKRLEELFPGTINPGKLLPFSIDRSGFLIPKTPVSKKEITASPISVPQVKSSTDDTKQEIKALSLQLQQQQQSLTKALEQIALLNEQPASSKTEKPSALNDAKKLEQLRIQVEKKDAEIQRLKQQDAYSQKIQEHFEEVQAEMERLQERLMKMEKQAWQATELSIQLEHAEQSQLQLEKSLLKKEEKLRELSLENQRLHEAFNELEDKLSEANLQRQQLQKKVQLLEELNADMMQIAEANRKLKTEISRVAELESMLQLMTEGRNKRGKKE